MWDNNNNNNNKENKEKKKRKQYKPFENPPLIPSLSYQTGPYTFDTMR